MLKYLGGINGVSNENCLKMGMNTCSSTGDPSGQRSPSDPSHRDPFGRESPFEGNTK